MIPAIDHTDAIDETKSYRKELKLKPSVAETLKRAAASVGMDVSTFIASYAYKAAQDIERAQHETVLSSQAFDAFAQAADRPGERNPNLTRLLATRGLMVRDD